MFLKFFFPLPYSTFAVDLPEFVFIPVFLIWANLSFFERYLKATQYIDVKDPSHLNLQIASAGT